MVSFSTFLYWISCFYIFFRGQYFCNIQKYYCNDVHKSFRPTYSFRGFEGYLTINEENMGNCSKNDEIWISFVLKKHKVIPKKENSLIKFNKQKLIKIFEQDSNLSYSIYSSFCCSVWSCNNLVNYAILVYFEDYFNNFYRVLIELSEF